MHSCHWQSVTVLVLLVIISTKFSEVSSDCSDRRGLCIAENRIVQQEAKIVLQKEHSDNALDRSFRDSLRRDAAARRTHSGNRDEQRRSTYVQSDRVVRRHFELGSRSKQIDKLENNLRRDFSRNNIPTTSRNVLRDERVPAERRLVRGVLGERNRYELQTSDRQRVGNRIREGSEVDHRSGEDRVDSRGSIHRVDRREREDRLDRREREERLDRREREERLNRREREDRSDRREREDRADRRVREDRGDRRVTEDRVGNNIDRRVSENRMDRQINEDRVHRGVSRMDRRISENKMDSRVRENRMDRRIGEDRSDRRDRLTEIQILDQKYNRDLLVQRMQHERDNLLDVVRTGQVGRQKLIRRERREMRRLELDAKSNDRSERSLDRYIKSSNDDSQRLYDRRYVIAERRSDAEQEREDTLRHEQRHEELHERRQNRMQIKERFANQNFEIRRNDSLRRDSRQEHMLYVDNQNFEIKRPASLYPSELSWNVCQALLVGAIFFQFLKYKNDMDHLKSFNGFVNDFPILSPIKIF